MSRRINPSEKTITTQCPECGKEFTYYKSWPRKYCSKKCSGKNTASNIHRWKPSAFQTTCEQCGKEYTATPKTTRGRFCSFTCFTGWMKEHAPAGPDNPKFGKKYGRPAHLPPPVTKRCPVCGKEFTTKKSHLLRRVTCSRECSAVLQAAKESGENNFNWRGGYLPYYGPNWRPQRRAARKRDGYKCQRCGITEDELGREMDVHHIRRFGDFSDYKEANSLKNLVTLCNRCHLVVEHETGGR